MNVMKFILASAVTNSNICSIYSAYVPSLMENSNRSRQPPGGRSQIMFGSSAPNDISSRQPPGGRSQIMFGSSAANDISSRQPPGGRSQVMIGNSPEDEDRSKKRVQQLNYQQELMRQVSQLQLMYSIIEEECGRHS